MKYLTMTGFTVRTGSDRWTLGYEGENNSRTLQIKTTDDLTDFATVNLLIDTIDCGAMTVTTVGNFKVLSMVLTAAMLGEAGKKTCQLLMMDSGGTVIKKTNQFYMVVCRSNVIEGTVPDSPVIIAITDYIDDAINERVGDEILEGKINDWLDDHPEATTTVQDGSLTEEKFSNALKLKTIKDYVTPEMFGDISTPSGASAAIELAISNAVTNNVPVVIPKSITISEPIELSAQNIQLYILGTLTYTGSDYAIKCQYPRQKVDVYSIICANGGGISIDTSLANVQYVDIDVMFARCLKSCFTCVTSDNHWVTYIKTKGDLWVTTGTYPTVNVEAGVSGSFIGEVQINDANLLGEVGVRIIGSLANVNAVRLERVSIEGITGTGIIVDSARHINVLYCRYAELQGTGHNVLELIGEVGLLFTGTYNLRIDKVNITNLNQTSSGATMVHFNVPIFSPSNTHIANGWHIVKNKKSFSQPVPTSTVYSGAEVNVTPYVNSGYVQTIRFSGNVDTVVNLSEYHNAETFPYIAFNIPGSKTYTIKDSTGETIATINGGYGQYILTLDYNHFVIKKT